MDITKNSLAKKVLKNSKIVATTYPPPVKNSR